MIAIRRAAADDCAVLLELVAAYWRLEAIPFGAEVRGPLERLLADPRLGAGWIAWADEVPVGYLLAVFAFSLEHRGLTAEIDELFVQPHARAAGVGARLLQTAEAAFLAAGCTNVSLQLHRENAHGRQFYRRHGFGPRSSYELLDKTLVGRR